MATQRSSHVEPTHSSLFGSTYLQPLLPDHILLEVPRAVGRYYELSKIGGFSGIFLDILEASLMVFFFSGHSMHYSYSKSENLVVMWWNCIAAFIQCKLKKEWLWKANIIICSVFLLHIRLYSYFPALFLLTGFQVPWRRNKSSCLDNTKRSKLFWPCLCLCNPCMCDAGKWSTGTKNVKH